MEAISEELLPDIEALESVLDSIDIPYSSLYRNQNEEKSKKPQTYAVYYVMNEDADLASNDDFESEYTAFTVSFFIKSKKFRAFRRAAAKKFLDAGFFVSFGFETYEQDTGYTHFDLEITYYGG